MTWMVESFCDRLLVLDKGTLRHDGSVAEGVELTTTSTVSRSVADHDVLVAGAGFTGASAARVLAEAGRRVLVLEPRPTSPATPLMNDATGLLVHRYGPHIFHTGNQQVWEFLSRFTTWRAYQHRVLSRHGGTLYPIPINRTTLEQFFDIRLEDDAAARPARPAP